MLSNKKYDNEYVNSKKKGNSAFKIRPKSKNKKVNLKLIYKVQDKENRS